MKGTTGCTYGNFWSSGSCECQLASLGPRKLTIKINKCILIMGMGFLLL